MNWIGIGMYLHSQIVAGASHSVSHSVHFLSDHVLLRCLNLLNNSFQYLSLGNYLLSCFFVQRLQWKAKLVDNGGEAGEPGQFDSASTSTERKGCNCLVRRGSVGLQTVLISRISRKTRFKIGYALHF